MTATADDIIKRLNSLESSRGDWAGRWQQCAEYVMPRFGEHQKKADRIFDSTAPLAVGRFASALEGSLAPRTRKWHGLTSGIPELDKVQEVRRYYEQVTDIVFRARYSPRGNFANQLMECFYSLGVLGTAVLFIDDDPGQGLRYRCLPLHECYLAENSVGAVDTVFRCYKLTARQSVQEFGDDLPDNIKQDADNPARLDVEHEFIHAVFPRRERDPHRRSSDNLPIASIHLARAGRKVVRERGYRTMPYAVSRFYTTPGEVYGRSPAMTVMADIVKVNAMAKTLLRASQKMVDPPLLLPDDETLPGFSLKAGSLNYGGLDDQGKQRVAPLQINGNLPIGLEMIDQCRTVINEAFYLNLFQVLVQKAGEQTATEVIERAQEKAQLLGPAIGLQQTELLDPTVQREVDVLIEAGALDHIPMPEILMAMGGAVVKPKYETALVKTLGADEGVSILNAVQGLGALVQINPSAALVLNAKQAARDLCEAMGVPARDLLSEEEVAALEQQQQQQQQQQQEAMMAMQAGGAAVQGMQGLAGAEKSFQESRAIAQGTAGNA